MTGKSISVGIPDRVIKMTLMAAAVAAARCALWLLRQATPAHCGLVRKNSFNREVSAKNQGEPENGYPSHTGLNSGDQEALMESPL